MKSKIVREINYNGRKYLSLKHTADLSGYHRDYIGQLIRKGDLSAEKIGFAWFIEEAEWNRFLNKKNGALTENISESRGLESKNTGDAWEKELLGKNSSNLEFRIKLPKITLPKIPFSIVSLGILSLLATVAIYAYPNKALLATDYIGALAERSIVKSANIAIESINQVKNSAVLVYRELPSLKILEKRGNTYFLALSLPDISFPAFQPPFSLEDSRLAVLDIKNKFTENLFLWKDYLASFSNDIKIIAQDFLSIKPKVVEAPTTEGVGAPTPAERGVGGSKIITFASSTPLSSSLPLTKGEGQGVGVKEIRTVVERVLSGLPA
ncbi:MAG: helix-turn-helix domain-containing protein, partial [Candidatus Giovannonibacteria bacterium]|nr:helix-turn-helix domain-containing protein [Candidatus Giovannonibacteria bacterium]